jgi:protein-tyrosine phosphatase
MLANCLNLRDFGGYETLDGRRVREGMLYRSGTLSKLDARDHEIVAGLGIKLICDLRQDDERALEPSNWCDPDVQVLTWAYHSLTGPLLGRLSEPDATEAEAAAGMEAFYAKLPLTLGAAIRDIFTAVAEGSVPVLIHCAAGKDRTGVVAGFLLEALGVPRALVLTDYARSAKLVDYERILRNEPQSGLGLARGGVSMTGLPMGIRARLLASDEAYLAAAFRMAEAQAGSVTDYLTSILEVAPATIAGLRAGLLA